MKTSWENRDLNRETERQSKRLRKGDTEIEKKWVWKKRFKKISLKTIYARGH